MPVCSYYLRGNCKFGDSCRNEHPRGAFGNLSWTNQNRNDKTPFPFTLDTLTKDLTVRADKPLWPLSSYGPAKGEPNLLSGLDESPEELRARAVTALHAGNANEYIAYENSKINAAEGVYANVRSNTQQAYDTAVKQSPYSSLFDSTKASTFNKPTSAFGTSSTFGVSKSAFGPAFSQPSFGATPSAFGQPVGSTTTVTGAFGQPVQPPSTSAFGQLTAPTGTVTGAFGQPIQPPPSSAFGTPAFGQTSQPQTSIIKPASGAFANFTAGPNAFSTGESGSTTGGGFSAFAGRPSAFGLGAAAPQTTSAFGQPSFGAPSAFGALTKQQQQQQPSSQPQSAFGAFAQLATSALRAPAPAQTTSAFGASAPTQTTSAFGAPAPAQSTSFGAPASAQTTSVFGILAQQKQPVGTSVEVSQASGFGAGRPTQPTSSAFSVTTTTGTTSLFGQPSQPTSGFSAFGSTPAFSASQRTSGASPTKLPTGKPDFDRIIATELQSLSVTGTSSALYKAGTTPYDEQLGVDYMGIVPKEALEAFKSKRFELGKVPDCVPPLEMR